MSVQGSQGLQSLNTIIKRLEAATSRIEDIAAAGWKVNPQPTGSASTSHESAPAPPPPPPAPALQEVPKSVTAFDEAIIEGKLKPWLELTRSFAGPSVVEIAALVEKQYQEMRTLLATAAACTKPDEKTLETTLAPFNATIEAISHTKEANRKDRDWFTHLMVIAEYAPFVAWVLQSKPGPYINEVKDQTLYYGNRVLKEYKEKDARHAEWVRSLTATLDELRKYVMEYHTTGLTWNPRGVSVATYKSSAPSAPAAGSPPPPPPPPPPPAAMPPPPAGNAAAGGTAAVFAELNRGDEVTKNLRKVDRSQMTHKNPELRTGSTVPSSSGPGNKRPLKPAKPQALMGKKPAKFALEGKSWVIEYQEEERNLVVEDTQLNQAINIFGCKNSTIQIKGKINAVTLVNCSKTSVLVDSVVSSISITKSPSFAIQITGSAPMIQIDSTDSGQIYLSKNSLNAEITTAKCSSINISLPVEGEEDGVFEEQPVPEMLRTVVNNGKLMTTVVEHVGYASGVTRSFENKPSQIVTPFYLYPFEQVPFYILKDSELIKNQRVTQENDYFQTPHRGMDGRFMPVEQVTPMEEQFIGGFHPGLPPPSPAPPELPPKDMPVGYGQAIQPTMSNVELTKLSAVERSRALQVARMTPHLQFMVGPLLRYDTIDANGVWHGAALVVTADSGSSYDPSPCTLLEWDPEKRTPSNKRAKSIRRPHAQSFDLGPHPADPHSTSVIIANQLNGRPSQSHSPSAQVQNIIGEELYVHAGNGGTFTFWRFPFHIPLGPNEMVITYSINKGQKMQFFVPGRSQNMRWAAHSCNGFSAGVNPDDFRGSGFSSGYDPCWMDLLSKHAEEPFHAMVGGGDQIYCDGLTREPELQEWVSKLKPEEKKSYPLTDEVSEAIDRYYFSHYCSSFRNGAFARANSSIPMMNMCDDHGMSSVWLLSVAILISGQILYFFLFSFDVLIVLIDLICWLTRLMALVAVHPDDLQLSPVFKAIGSKGYFWFLLFQCFINTEVDGLDDRRHINKSIIIGLQGPYMPFPSHSFLGSLGPQTAILLLDCRAERKKDQVCSPGQYQKVFERLNELSPTVEHLIVQLGVPIAYPRMVFLESMLESKLNPLVALGRNGALGLSGFVNKFNADAELLDDLNDHWTARAHKKERNWFIEQLQKVAEAKRLRISFLSGDVHCGAVGLFKTLKEKNQPEVPPAQDPRYMVNVVTSAIVNTPPPAGVITMVSSLASKTHKTLHHIKTDEIMMPVFQTETDGSSRKQKFIMGRRNWCQVSWDEGSGDLIFDLRVEKEKGAGTSVGYVTRVPPPRWKP
ncbi:hypothetical protein D9758_003279 [Tetrapyrgos nigripes]|uniref:Adenylyl cyclase-associated protein n=1 Tax=Tetrapyrgos nigripes TaxID=182062 RepID=A0A8H5GIH2_9AGAR|nr:hypothetical protein D9758_003279 [Tetrapyrgos nigripes]